MLIQHYGPDWRTWPPAMKLQFLQRLRETAPPSARFDRYAADPVAFSRDELGSDLTPRQVEIMESVRDHRITIVRSANSVGKTFVAADAALWFTRCFQGANVFTAAAPPLENLERLLWGEINSRLLEHGDLFSDGRRGYLRVHLAPKHFCVGVAIPQSGSPAQREAKFSGKHAPFLLFIVDEGDAVPEEVYRGIESCMSGGMARLLVLFNPREQTGPVYQMEKAGAHVIELSAFDHPNVASGEERIAGAVTREQVVRRIAVWSRPAIEGDEPDARDPDWFQVPAFLDGETATLDEGTKTEPLIGGQWRKVTNPALSYMVLARYPGQAERQLISRAWVEAAQQRWLAWRVQHGDRPPEGVCPLHGQDVAEFGMDRNVACFRYGGYVAPFETWSGVDVLVTGDRAARMARERNARESFVDATGVGSGVPPAMRRWWERREEEELARLAEEEPEKLEDYVPYEGQATPIKVAQSPTEVTEEGEFSLLRDQLWWLVREWLRTDPGAMLPPDPDLADELCSVRYRSRRGKIIVSDKEALRATLHRSPDKADALCLTFAPSGTFDLGWA
jgi:phage terminase large subunit